MNQGSAEDLKRKFLEDILENVNGGVYTDDCLIEKITASWSTEVEYTEIKIYKYVD